MILNYVTVFLIFVVKSYVELCGPQCEVVAHCFHMFFKVRKVRVFHVVWFVKVCKTGPKFNALWKKSNCVELAPKTHFNCLFKVRNVFRAGCYIAYYLFFNIPHWNCSCSFYCARVQMHLFMSLVCNSTLVLLYKLCKVTHWKVSYCNFDILISKTS